MCSLVFSINSWVHVRYKPEPLAFSYPEVPHIFRPESPDTSPSIHVQIFNLSDTKNTFQRCKYAEENFLEVMCIKTALFIKEPKVS